MSKVWNNTLVPTLNHNSMLTNYDFMLKKNEIKQIDDYVIQNNIPTMNLEVFKSIVCNVFPTHRAEQLVGEFYHDDQGYNTYKKYITFETDK